MRIENPMSAVSIDPVKKAYPEDRLVKLAFAREKALMVRRQNSVLRKKAELERLETRLAPPLAPPLETDPIMAPAEDPEVGTEDPVPALPETPSVACAPPAVSKVKPPKRRRQPMLVVEQSSDDSDTFQHDERVVFVKRVRKPKRDAPDAAPSAPLVAASPPPAPQSPPPPHVTAKQQHAQQLYAGMFGGEFLNGGRGGRLW